MNKPSINYYPILYLLLATLCIRLISLGLYPLMDPTEARYAEIARLMIETNNWLTPQFDYNIPFWGKPPIHNWISALSLLIFGNNEFAARFPHWLAGVATLFIIGLFAKKQDTQPLLAVLITLCCPIFAINCGAVMTDMLLTLSFTFTMIGFYRGWQGYYRWGYVAFLGLGLGLMSKGPLVIILSALSVGPWLILQHGFKGAFVQFWYRFPVISGTLIMLLCAAPWYIAAEHHTPGFLRYFFVGEHFYRFIESGWDGDLYGVGRETLRGTIWLFWILGTAPWSIFLIFLTWKQRTPLLSQQNKPGWVSFLYIWLLTPLFFFTLSGNIQLSYILPSTPALGLLLAYLIQKTNYPNKITLACGSITPLLLIVAVIAFNTDLADEYTDKNLISGMNTTQLPLYCLYDRSFSSRFYTAGKSQLIESISSLQSLPTPFYLMGEEESFSKESLQTLNCELINKRSTRLLYLCH